MATLLVLTGIAFVAGGIALARLGGSLYYVLAGIAVLVSGVELARRRVTGTWIYGGVLLATLGWAWWEAGWDCWALLPRIALLLALAIPVALCIPSLLRSEIRGHLSTASRTVAGALAIVLVILFERAFVLMYIVRPPSSGSAVNGTQRTERLVEGDVPASSEWRHYGRTPAATRFSSAEQITPSNVRELQQAWVYRTGDPEHPHGELQATPLQIGDSLYFCTDRNVVIALDAETGQQRWRFDPATRSTTFNRCRGVAYHEARKGATDPHGTCDQRILTSTIDARLIGLDARTGQPCHEFGDRGFVDLRAGLGQVTHNYYIQTSAPTVVRDLVILGAMVHDNVDDGMPAGVVRAFSALTGALVWAWDPANPAITGVPPPGETYTRGAPNMWSAPSYDDALGLLYVPLAAPTAASDFWGGWRTEAIEKYANSIVALEVDTGRPRWHFQAVHHDVWDYDLPPQPTLFDMPDGRGGRIRALIQGTKHGEIFVLDRRDGRPIVPVTEKPVPRSGAPDDRIAPTQPHSAMPAIGAEPLSEARMWGLTPFDQLWCRIRFRSVRYEGRFTPPSLDRSTLVYPGVLGGMNWGGVTVDERRGYLLVNDIRLPIVIGLQSREIYNQKIESLRTGEAAGHWLYVPLSAGVRYGTAQQMFLSPLGIPCNAPPWGTLTAIDLASRQIVWQIPLGSGEDRGPMSPRLGLPIQFGLPTLGGSIVTSSGVLFFSGTQDFYLRALDGESGRELWKGRLPVGSQATPITFISPRSGRQFVVVVAGGAPQMRQRGDYVIAFALPVRR